jgi:hypothetical protein
MISPRLPGDTKLEWSGKPHQLRYNRDGQRPHITDLLRWLLAPHIATFSKKEPYERTTSRGLQCCQVS